VPRGATAILLTHLSCPVRLAAERFSFCPGVCLDVYHGFHRGSNCRPPVLPSEGSRGIRDVAKNDKLRSKQALPHRARFTASGHSLVDGLRADAEDRREGPAGVAEDLAPEVRDSVPGATDGGAAAALPEMLRE